MDNKYILKVNFYKEKDMVFFSQLDIFRLFMRALRRANFPIIYTHGFNPHPKISFSHALKLGKEGEFKTTFYFNQEIKPQDFKRLFLGQIPADLKIISVETA